MQKTELAQPTVFVSHRGAERIRAGHVWVYRSDLVDAEGVAPGALVMVQEHDARGNALPEGQADKKTRPRRFGTLGTAFYSSTSEIALRLLSRKRLDDPDQTLRDRIREAIEYRERFIQNTNAYRVVFSEGDFLPGLMVDRYNDILSVQILTQAMDAEHIRELFVTELQERLQPASIVEKVDARVRKLEQLPEKSSGLLFGEKTSTEIEMNGVRFRYEALGGQKTGAFLDQRENYAAAEKYARGEALDVFCYQGGFALHLARACASVTGIDSSRPALELAEQNATLNGKELEWIEANAFDLLRDYADAARQYDCIVLDPPAFAKTRRDLPTALRGYKELNLRALKMLRPGGILVSCSCSYHVSVGDLLETIQSAAQDTHRIVRILENRGAAKDHPNVMGIPETAYLKCAISQVS